jgi:3-oxoacyl-[acyl-carrier protein] reductase
MDLGLRGKVVLLTGGSAGIGKAAARLFAEEGAHVVIASRTARNLEDAAQELRKETGAKVEPIVCDIRDPDAIDALLARAVEQFGGLDVVVNNAGAALPKPYAEASDQDWHDVLGYKLLGYVHTAVKALPYLRERGGGRIINVTGSAGREPNPWTTSTGIINAGLGNFTKTLSSQVAKDNILVNAVSPGPIDTGRWTGITGGQRQAADNLVAQVPLKRLGQPDEVAAAIVFLASSRASYITGACLTVDGGRCNSVMF